MAFLKWDFKDPNEVIDYALDWDTLLEEDDAIATSTWIITPVTLSPLTKDSDSFANRATTIWLSGGLLSTPSTKYTLTNRVTTDDGRTWDQSVTLKIKAR